MRSWYSKYLELLLKKKEAIREWRDGKDAKQKLEEQMQMKGTQRADTAEEVRSRQVFFLENPSICTSNFISKKRSQGF